MEEKAHNFQEKIKSEKLLGSEITLSTIAQLMNLCYERNNMVEAYHKSTDHEESIL